MDFVFIESFSFYHDFLPMMNIQTLLGWLAFKLATIERVPFVGLTMKGGL